MSDRIERADRLIEGAATEPGSLGSIAMSTLALALIARQEYEDQHGKQLNEETRARIAHLERRARE